MSDLCSGGKWVLVLHTNYVLRVPYSCGAVLVYFSFFVSGGKLFLVLLKYLVYNTVVRLCQFFVVAGNLI